MLLAKPMNLSYFWGINFRWPALAEVTLWAPGCQSIPLFKPRGTPGKVDFKQPVISVVCHQDALDVPFIAYMVFFWILYIYIYLNIYYKYLPVVDLNVFVRSFYCEQRACYVGNSGERFFCPSSQKIFFIRETVATVGYYESLYTLQLFEWPNTKDLSVSCSIDAPPADGWVCG